MSPLFKPLQQIGRAFMSTAAHIVQSGDYVFVAFQNPDRKAQKKMDVFKGGQQVGTLDVSGTPFAVDAQGRIYSGRRRFPESLPLRHRALIIFFSRKFHYNLA